ncbi:hypothetical protein RQN30_02260 [Arcanobacterium hippocoleae]
MSDFIYIVRDLGGFAGIAAVLAVIPQLITIKKNTDRTAIKVGSYAGDLKEQIDRLENYIESEREFSIILRKELVKRLDSHDREFKDIKENLKSLISSRKSDLSHASSNTYSFDTCLVSRYYYLCKRKEVKMWNT